MLTLQSTQPVYNFLQKFFKSFSTRVHLHQVNIELSAELHKFSATYVWKDLLWSLACSFQTMSSSCISLTFWGLTVLSFNSLSLLISRFHLVHCQFWDNNNDAVFERVQMLWGVSSGSSPFVLWTLGHSAAVGLVHWWPCSCVLGEGLSATPQCWAQATWHIGLLQQLSEHL